MIRPARPADIDALMALAEESDLLDAGELAEVRDMLAAHVAGAPDPTHRWATDDDGGLAGLAYFAAEPYTDGVWTLYLLAVDSKRRGAGRGAALVAHVEHEVAAAGARILLIETSGRDRFEGTRAFYERCGYDEEARIRDYYGPGDDKVVFWKSVA